MSLNRMHLNEQRFLTLLTDLIGVSEKLQNNPPRLVPQENLAIEIVRRVLDPFSTDQGGLLQIKHVSYVEGRGNLIITYPACASISLGKTVSFVGSHLDVVPADPSTWTVPPFVLSRSGENGDKLSGRGTTDCLGHVALLTDFLAALAENRPALKTDVIVVFIANEENSSIAGIGVDEMERNGLLARCKNGPLYWVDTADSVPCVGTGGAQVWTLTAKGKLCHSGMPQLAINPHELAMDAIFEIQRRFYVDFPAHPDEKRYSFATPSTMKPTTWSSPDGGMNQIKAEAKISGDIRLTPFYSMEDVKKRIEQYVAEINARMETVHSQEIHGPVSKYVLPQEGLKGRVEISWEGHAYHGVACDMNAIGYKAMSDAFRDVTGNNKPFSVTGSLPLVRELQDAGFQLQMFGFGKLAVYHCVDEYCLLSDMKKGFQVVAKIVDSLNV